MSDPGDEDNENDTMMTTRVISAGIMKQTRHTLLVLVLLSQGIVSQSVIGHVSGRDRRVESREGGVRGGNCCYCTG